MVASIFQHLLRGGVAGFRNSELIRAARRTNRPHPLIRATPSFTEHVVLCCGEKTRGGERGRMESGRLAVGVGVEETGS
jgi:hypothetical protein